MTKVTKEIPEAFGIGLGLFNYGHETMPIYRAILEQAESGVA